MSTYEYSVVPAPQKGKKAKGLKTAHARFAYALQDLMNEMAGDGWEFQRAETLPSVERSGLASPTTVYRNVLVFRRPHTGGDIAPPKLIEDLSDTGGDGEAPDDQEQGRET